MRLWAGPGGHEFKGLSTTGEEKDTSTDTKTDTSDLEAVSQFGMAKYENNFFDGSRDFTGWFDETRDTAIDGADILNGSRGRILERG